MRTDWPRKNIVEQIICLYSNYLVLHCSGWKPYVVASHRWWEGNFGDLRCLLQISLRTWTIPKLLELWHNSHFGLLTCQYLFVCLFSLFASHLLARLLWEAYKIKSNRTGFVFVCSACLYVCLCLSVYVFLVSMYVSVCISLSMCVIKIWTIIKIMVKRWEGREQDGRIF